MSVSNDDPRLLLFKRLLAEHDRLAMINDPETQLRASEAFLDMLGQSLKELGFGDAAMRVFRHTLPSFDRTKDEDVAKAQEGMAELMLRVLAPIAPGAFGHHFGSQLLALSQGDDVPLYRRTRIRNRQIPYSAVYSAAKEQLVCLTHYDAARDGVPLTALMAERAPGSLGGEDRNQIRKDWLRGDFVDQNLAAWCASAGEARRLGSPLSPEEQEAEGWVTSRSVEELVSVINETRRKPQRPPKVNGTS